MKGEARCGLKIPSPGSVPENLSHARAREVGRYRQTREDHQPCQSRLLISLSSWAAAAIAAFGSVGNPGCANRTTPVLSMT